MTARTLRSLLIASTFLVQGAVGAAEVWQGPSVDFSHGALRVSANRRFLMHADQTHFLYLGDTAWELFHRTTREEAERYLENRRQKGFTVIQAVVLAEFGGLDEPNAYGHLPFVNRDPTKPNEEYFKHVDFIVQLAESKGLYIAMLPAWVRYITWPEFKVITNDNARAYGEYLAKRYRASQNIIWVLGGDMNIEDMNQWGIWNGMGVAIRDIVAKRHLITYHPRGGRSSSDWYHTEPWLDFNMIQSGHSRRDTPNFDMIARDLFRTPPKPVLDAEPNYEDHPIAWKPENGRFDAQDVRRAAYWSVFAGACGHTHGAHDIWQFKTAKRAPISAARNAWYDAMDAPGSWAMLHLRRLVASRPWMDYVPDQSVVTEAGWGGNRIAAMRSEDSVIAYLPAGGAVQVQLNKRISGTRLTAWWYNPRTGQSSKIGEFDQKGTQEFSAPEGPARSNDWVLVIDNAAKNRPAPGSR